MPSRFLSKRLPLAQSLSRFSSAAAVCAALAMAGGASAATYQWDPLQTGPTTGASGGAGLWNAADLSWFNGATTTDIAWPNTGDTAVFGGTGGVVSLGGAITVNALQFDKGGYTIDNGGTAANTLTLSSTGAAITVTNATDSATISAVIAGSTAWSKAGLGALTLSGANTFTGGLTLNAGILNINNATALGATGSTFTIAGGTIDNTSGAAITLTSNNPQAWSGDFAFTGTNALNLGTGAVSLSATRNVAVNASTLTVGGIISGTGFGVTKTGAGTLALAGANTFTGGLTINGGTVSATAGSNLGAGPITLDGGTLALNQTAQITLGAAQVITVGASGGTIDNAVAFKLLMNTAGGLTGSGTLTRTASVNSSSLSNTFQISAANTGFTGAVILNGGVTEVSANGLGTGATAGNSITVNAGAELAANNSTMANALVLNGGIIGGDGGNSTFSGPITVNGSTSVRLGDFYQNTNRNLTITGNLTGTGALTTINNGNTATNATGQILTLNPATGDNSGFTGALNISTGNNVVFSTANALTGGTVVVNTSATQMGGVGYGYDFGSTVPTFTHTRTGTTDGGVFGINTTLAATTTLDMSTLGGGGMFLGSQTSGTYAADTLGADASVYRLGGGTGTLTLPNATLTGANNLVVGDSRANGNGTVVLGGANTFTGSVSVANGTLSVGTINSVSGGAASSNLGAPTTVADGTINLGSNAATGGLRYTGAGETTDRVINLAGTTGGGTLDQSGTGVLKFTSDLTFTGAGTKTLTLQGSTTGTGEISGKIANSSLTIAKGGTGTWLLSGAGNSVKQLTLSGVLDIGSGGISVLNGGSSTIQATSGTATINATGGGVLTIGNGSTTDGADIGAASGATLVINANMATATAGAPFEVYNGTNSTGVVVLNGTNAFTGNTYINTGVLQVSSIAGALGTGSTINIGSGTNTTNTLRYTGTGETTSKVINLNATTGAVAIEQAGTGLLKFTGNFTATGAGSKTFTLLGSTSGAGEIAGPIMDNSTANKTSLAKSGTGTWTLSGVNTYTGSTTVNSGTLVLNGETGSLASNGLALGTNANFTYLGKSNATQPQALGALTSTASQNTVTSTYGGSGTTELVFTTLGRSATSSLNLVTSGGTAGTTNIIRATGQAAGFVNAGIYYNGNNFAYNTANGATSIVRAPIYGTDSNFVNAAAGTTLGSLSTSPHVQVQGDISAQTTGSVATLRFDAARSLTITSGNTLTVANGGIIAAGGTSTIKTGTVTAGSAEMNIRTDAATDALTISGILGGSGGLTKSGAGTLTLSNTANTFTGSIFVNGGTLAYAGSGTADQLALGAAGTRTVTLTNGAILSPTSTSNPSASTKSFVVGAGGATFNVANGVTLQLDDAGQFSGTGDLTVTGAGSGTVFLSNQAFTFSGNVFVNSGTLKLSANSGVLGSGAGRTITIGSGGVVDAQITNLPLGLVLNGTGISAGGALVNSGTAAASFTGPVTINSGATIGGAGTGGITLSGNVSGAGLTKVGSNTLTLSGVNSYGNTTINGGVVIFNSPTAFGANGASVTVASSATAAAGYAIDQGFLGRFAAPTSSFTIGLAANSSNDLDFNTAGLTNASLGATGAFTYTGTLTPNGSTYRLGGGGGTLTLGNTNAVTGAKDLLVNGNTILASSNDYSGTTTVNAGTLTLTATSNSSTITINSGATLQLGTGGATGSLGASTLTNNGTLAYNHSDDVTTDIFTGNGAISQANGTSTLTINSATTAIGRLYVSASGGTIDLGATNRTIGVDGGNSIQMFASGTGTINASGGAAITLAVGSTDIGANSGGTLIVNPVIQGTNAIDIYNGGAGTVVFNGANTYSGATNIQSGTLSVGSLNSVATNATLGTVHADSSNLGAPTTVASGTINLGSGTAITTAALKYTGAGETTDRVLNLSGSTNGATIDQSGTGLLKFTSNLTASGAGSKTLTLQGSTAGAGEIAGAIVDNSPTNKTAITKAGTGTWTLSGTNTYTGATAINGGTLALTGTLGSTAITVGTAGTFTQSSTGAIGGTASLTTSGNTTLSGTNTFTGNVTVSGGPLTITNSSALGAGTKTITVVPAPNTNPTGNPSLRLDGSAGDITLPAAMSFTTSFDTIGASGSILDGGAIINVAGNNTIAGNFNLTSGGGGTTFRSNAGTLTLSGNFTPSITARSIYLRGDGNGVISGNIVNGSTVGLPVTKDVGSGTWTLSGTNTYTGVTTVSAGTLQFAKKVSLYNNTPASWTATNIIVNNGGTLALNVGGTGEFIASDVDTLKALGTATGGFTNGSTLGLDTTNASGGNFAYDSAIANTNGGVNAIGLTKLGANTLTLSGANTYTGPTNVKAGKLAIALSGSISGSTQVKIDSGATLDVSAFNGGGGFTVLSTQTFIDNGQLKGDIIVGGAVAGSGSVDGSVTALPGSTISPGNSAGTLSIAGNFSLNAAAHLALELGTTAAIGSDRLSIGSGNVTLGGSLDITLLPTFADNIGDTFTIILNGGGSAIDGLFSNVTPTGATTGLLTLADGHQFVVNYAANADGGAVANDVALTIAAVPEPSTIVAMLGGAGMLLGLRRRKGSR
ncbi:autotransporter-associated beta strand repeat-containing protein [Verrucomicrobiota bacterium sgz303538]